jgi:hypothetical protein
MKDNLTRQENARLLRVLRNWLYNEVLPTASGKVDHASVELWLKKIFTEAVLETAKQFTPSEKAVERVVQTEIAKTLKLMGANELRFSTYVHELVKKEVAKQVTDAIIVEATITGLVTPNFNK